MKKVLSWITALALSSSPAIGTDNGARTLTQIVNDSCNVSSTESYDYCTLTDTSSTIDKLIAGKKVDKEIVFESDTEMIKYMGLGKENIRFPAKEGYNILLIPVGYEEPNELDQSMGYLADVLTDAFKKVEVNFSYLDVSMPIGIEKIDRWASLTNKDEANELKEIIKQFYPVDGLVIVLNHDQYLASGGDYPVFSGENSSGLYLAIHEVGHHLGLGDGYNRYYSPEELKGSELFLFSDKLEPRVKWAQTIVRPPIKFTGNYCICLPVYTFYGDDNIMNKYQSNRAILRLLKNDEPIFNPLQIEIMNRKVIGI
ncbi:MAG: M64 family metallopeptidase [archaeon]|nr:M64 family metallopeptidase [archaeon]